MRKPNPVGLPGLRGRVVRGPRDGRWYWRVERVDKSTAWSGWASVREVGDVLRDLEARGAAMPPAEPGGAIDSLDRLLRAYLAYLEDCRPDLAEGTMRVYRLRLRQVRESGGGGFDLERLDLGALEQLRANLHRRPLAPRSVRGCLHLVTAAWRWGRREGLTPDRELAAPEVRVTDGPRYTPTQEQIAQVVEVLDGWERLAVRLLWATGARIGEIAALTWDDVDLGRGEIRVDGKTGPRVVPLHGDLVEELAVWPRRRGRVLGVKVNTSRINLGRRIRAACEATGQRPWTPHALRRAAVDELQRAGVDVKTAASLLGHTEEVMLTYYRQVTDEDRRRAVARARLGVAPRVGQVLELPRKD